MTKYDELRQAFAAKRDAETEFVQKNNSLAHSIAFGLLDYLEAPKSFVEHRGKEQISRRYVEFYEKDGYGDEWKPVPNYTKAIEHRFDGPFTFRFGLALEGAEGSLAKRYHTLDVEAQRTGTTAHIKINDQHNIKCHEIDGQWADLDAVHELIFNIFLEELKKRPG